jgi:hypothetical protein
LENKEAPQIYTAYYGVADALIHAYVCSSFFLIINQHWVFERQDKENQEAGGWGLDFKLQGLAVTETYVLSLLLFGSSSHRNRLGPALHRRPCVALFADGSRCLAVAPRHVAGSLPTRCTQVLSPMPRAAR